MSFQDLLNHGFLGHYINGHVSGTAYAVLYGIGILCCTLSYLLGSLNFSIIISKYIYHDDIRNYGSGNAGTTNMLRTYGRRAAVMTLAGDALKAVVSCLIGYAILGYTGAYIAGFFCILGHCFPLYYRFKGGKGIVTVAFMLLMLDPIVFALLFVLFVILVAATKMVSFGSVICIMLFPLILYRFSGAGTPIIFAMLITILVVFMHRENIMRIYHGQESKLDFGKLFGKKSKENADGESAEDGDTEPTATAEEEEAADDAAENALPAARKAHAVSADKKKRRKKQEEQRRKRAGK